MKGAALVASCILMQCIAPVAAEPMSSADREEAERHLVANWRAEKMIEASVQTKDVGELQSQVFALAREIGKSEPGAAWRKSKNCYNATSMLMNTADDLRRSMSEGMTASRLISLRSSYKSWRESISGCEKDVGRKSKRLLVLDLEP